jgi:hypothetical protein
METNTRIKKKEAKKVIAKTKPVEADPFASVVDETPARKRAAKKAAPVATKPVTEPAGVKKSAKKAAADVAADPFAEVVNASSPVKKRTAKTAKAETKSSRKVAKKPTLDVTAEIATADPEVELSPVFKALADVSLPELQRENRARLQMQTPTRLYFYWSVKDNPWALIRDVFGDDLGSYTLVVKLIDTKYDREEIHQCDAAGNWWFEVEPDHAYQAEIGFYAPNRPYFRILHSNTVETPRRSPSPRAATDADWTVSANKFAEVLDVAGFSRDAFDVAMAGDDYVAAQDASHTAFSSFLGKSDYDVIGISAEEIRYAMIALASGATLEELRFKVSPALFAILQANAGNLEAGRAMSSLTEYFDIDETEFTEEQFGPAVFGASLVNFPRTLKTRTVSEHAPRYTPVSSHNLR